jgi:hypothetical protein
VIHFVYSETAVIWPHWDQKLARLVLYSELSKLNTLGTKEKVWFVEVFKLGRFSMYSEYREQDFMTHPL